jgi:hypothetical protein
MDFEAEGRWSACIICAKFCELQAGPREVHRNVAYDHKAEHS